ncbi:Activating signal cointegrator 1 complex subunit [Thalictrum thalictroides]|uniref:Activating signal cointegrator 1 complex subunit n=1 Tax=Thalictrum thalictroides TaxID=46969 RepID=A0A7J6VGF0_THATH|nr:Activating signal cointegrator 1 complex subunit [Thalictrum thalictroides]
MFHAARTPALMNMCRKCDSLSSFEYPSILRPLPYHKMHRINRGWRFPNSFLISNNSLHFLQGFNKSYDDGLSNTMNQNKNQKTHWRPISTQSFSTSQQGCVEKIQTESSFVEVEKCSTSSLVSDVQHSSKNAEITSGGEELPMSRVTELVGGSAGLADEKMESVQLVEECGRHSVSVEVAASLIRFIKGKGGSTQKQIEEETGAKIVFPSSKKENFIVIEGVSVESITKASEKIKVILEEAIRSPNLDYSHFVSLPLAYHLGLVDKLINFQNSILGISNSSRDANVFSESDGSSGDEIDNSDQRLDEGRNMEVKLKVEDENEQVNAGITKIPIVSYSPKASKSSSLSDLGIDKSIFIKPKTFHLTVLMLKLWNNERIIAATEVLQRVSLKVIDALEGRPVSVRLKGLECMKGSLAKARVLYMPVEVIGGEDRLLRACQVINDAYLEAGLVLEKDACQKLKLHGTVMNARHRKRKKMTKRFDSFDARSIVKQYGSEDWGDYIIPEVHLSQSLDDDILDVNEHEDIS